MKYSDEKSGVQINDSVIANFLAQFAEERHPNSFLFGATVLGKAIAPRVQAKLKTGLTADCLDIKFEDDILVQTKPSYGDNIMCEMIYPNYRPQMATIRPGVFNKVEGTFVAPETTTLESHLSVKKWIRNIKMIPVEQQTKGISDAKKIIGLGRGATDTETIKIAFEVANKINAQVGVTRPLTELDIYSIENQIGQSGHTVKPNVIINLGIQGASQYTTGMDKADLIISVNSDRNAPIFDISDYAYVGDVKEFLTELNLQI
ncbi:electron transfer flavoprotein subunit alpha/FixB family protein [Streptococcus sp. FT1-55]|uniref:electron transfer flavoprotein subunit alpha/FixB family protein n=1 Tax=Streptococcus sp. FT1-55 TaxID=3409805 RepID=UPI003BF53D60